MTIGSLCCIGVKVRDVDAWAAFATGVPGLMAAEPAGAARRFRLDDLAWRIALGSGDADGLAHVGFEVAGAAEPKALRAAGCRMLATATLGRHASDRMISLHAHTPAGSEVEFGYRAIEIGDATWRVARHDKPSSRGHMRPSAR